MSKEHINLGFIGAENSGKSVTAGHLIYKFGSLDKERIAQADQQAQEHGISKYAALSNILHAEHSKGIPFISPYNFETPKYKFTIKESEYPSKFGINMIDGNAMHITPSRADSSVLFIDSVNYDKDVFKKGQIYEYATISYVFGIKQMIVAINKMDDEAVNFSKERFDQISSEISTILTKIGYKPEQFKFVPISSLNGDNICEKSTNLSWWSDGTLIENLDSLQPPGLTQKPLRLPVEDVYKSKEMPGLVAVVGRVESGSIQKGQKIVFLPSTVETTVKHVQKHPQQEVAEAGYGETVGCFVDVPYSDVKRGYVCGDPSNDPPRECARFTARMTVLNCPQKISVGYEPLIKCHSACTQCRLISISNCVDHKDGNKVTENPESIEKGNTAVVVFEPLKPFVVEKEDDYPNLSHFIVRENKTIVAVGVIIGVEKKH